MDPSTLLGLLADEDRRRAVAALVLGARTPAEVGDATGLDVRRTLRALTRLVAGGLVWEESGGYALDEKAFAEAAQQARPAEAAPEDLGVDADAAKVLRNFVKDGRLTSIPMAQSKRRVVLDWLAAMFEPGKIYPERDVNLIIGKVHDDYAALRRYLVDDEFLERRDGFYWRAGGTFDIE